MRLYRYCLCISLYKDFQTPRFLSGIRKYFRKQPLCFPGTSITKSKHLAAMSSWALLILTQSANSMYNLYA